MMLNTSSIYDVPLAGFDRTPAEQALENLAQALRVLDLVPAGSSDLCPHPLTIVRAEIENARRYFRADLTAPGAEVAEGRSGRQRPRRAQQAGITL